MDNLTAWLENGGYEQILERGDRMLCVEDLRLLQTTAQQINARKTMEIGSLKGCSAMLFGLLARETDGHHWCVDCEIRPELLQNIQELELEEHLTLIEESSPWVNGLPFNVDYGFVDGGHGPLQVLADFLLVDRHLRDGGRIAFHDICGPKQDRAGVRIALGLILAERCNLWEIGRKEVDGYGTVVFEKRR